MVNTIEKEIERMENNKRLETMVKKIGEWEGDFDSLVNEFDSNDYLFLLENTRFVFGYIIENNIYDAYNDKDWYSFLKLYIKDLLFTHIDEDIMSKTDNLYRLWFETV